VATNKTVELNLHHGAPVWGGWLFVALGAAAIGGWRYLLPSEDAAGLAVVGAIFGVAGLVVVVRAQRQQITLDAGRRMMVVVDRSRFGASRRVVPFNAIARLAVEDHTDPDPDARPFQQTTYRVVALLRDGHELPLTDFSRDCAAADGRRAELALLIEG
jgi:hypothetical protein